jgi:hypothetical protein
MPVTGADEAEPTARHIYMNRFLKHSPAGMVVVSACPPLSLA